MKNNSWKRIRQHKMKFIVLFYVLTALVWANRSIVLAQQPETFPDWFHALRAVQDHYHLLVGVEILPSDISDPNLTPIRVDFSEKDVSLVFNSLVTQRPAYMWSMDNGFYDVYPRTKNESLAGLSIGGYLITEASPEEASDALSNLPEVQRWLSEHKTRRVQLLNETDTRFRKAKMKASLSLKNVPLSTVLNQLTQLYGNRFWRITHDGGRGETVGIYF
jgi:hypothetical protein